MQARPMALMSMIIPRAPRSTTTRRDRHSHAKLVRDKPSQQKHLITNDRFDYEQKYAPDAEFKEMSERSRVFQTYQDEATKFDVDMVENWRDGLDMLLVFAALFSAVVTTFVVQSCQSLRVDYAQVTASLILRLIDVEVAISQGGLTNKLAQNTDPSISFKAQSADLWINGLWFTSLVLSLTTTLIAVLTKQWINEYMILPSGTPRDRSRVRHFRLIGLEQWHVPLIIGLLPVLMHVALGVFFAGLIIFVCSLSRTMAAALGAMTGVGALAYLISNVLPLFYANCPYKTPLALYSFRLVSWVRRRIRSLRGVPSLAISRSLKDVERTAVLREADNLDALSICWLHNTSSNASVQCVALQSLGGLPLQSIPIITGPDGISPPMSTPRACMALDLNRPAVIQAIRVHHRFEEPRAALRFGEYQMYTFIYHRNPHLSIGVSSDNKPNGLFQAALRHGLEFLNIDSTHDDGPPAFPWSQILRCAVQPHDYGERTLFSYALGPSKIPLVENGTAPLLSEALMTNMRPSFMRWLLHAGFSHDIPDDVLVVLTLLQTRSVQATSSLFDTAQSDIVEFSNHPNVERAAISFAFASEYLFKGLNRRFGFFERDPSWLTGALFEKLWHTGATHNGWELVANIFAYVSLFPALSDYTETICAYLVHQDWLHDIGARFTRLANSTTPRNDKLPDFWLVSMHASPVFVDAKILLLADAEKQQKLWDLAKLIRSDSWSECMKDAYGWDIHGQSPLHYRPLAELSSLITTFARDQARDHFSPPAYTDPDHQATESQSSPTKRSFYKRWRKLLQYELPISNP
ncbi:hypothetical protein CPB85DRAFT_1282256 [Mucidula mucida]|nr:hypothetical protein CPB85DRAFT_1282256 [Mucidula mucida]